ncbi:hypothetical protein CVT26_014993 [Gymnopilus dilepis]|uniref:Uncharacterized protein n=1 Tax=Gymnopilus dilepis TaxID=231916 RepID=A0A409XA48_9AGAR|nr:hypothetical protein CVT26_014993 [Gymnopilus dilepis]
MSTMQLRRKARGGGEETVMSREGVCESGGSSQGSPPRGVGTKQASSSLLELFVIAGIGKERKGDLRASGRPREAAR